MKPTTQRPGNRGVRLRSVLRPLGGLAVLAVVVWRIGPAPFLHGFASVTLRDVVLALAVIGLATLASAWRWQVVSERMGLELGFGAAVPAYYRSLFLNAVLPGGVLGDVHRGVRHGRSGGDLAGGLRSVLWDRGVGQVVQSVLVVAVLVGFPSPLRTGAVGGVAAAAVVLLALGGWLLVRTSRSSRSRLFRALPRVLGQDLRAVAADWASVWRLVVSSGIASGGQAALFLLALHSTGTALSLHDSLWLTMVVLVAASIPGSLAGWGPREGIAAWAFATAGLGAGAGVAATSLYGLLKLVGSLPGGVLLLQPGGSTLRGTSPSAALPEPAQS